MHRAHSRAELTALYSKLQWAGLALLLLDILLPFRMGLHHLTQIEIIHIAFDWMAMFLLTILLNCCIRGRRVRSRTAFIKLMVTVFFILFLDVGCWTVNGDPHLRLLNYLCNIGCNSGLLLSSLLYIDFVCDSLEIPRQSIARLYRWAAAMTVLGVALELLNTPFGYFYRIDPTGTYRRTPLGAILGALPFIFILGCGCVVVVRPKITLREKIDYLTYAIVPSCISLWYLITGLPPSIYLAAFVALVIVFGNIYIRQEVDMERTMVESARKDAQLAWQRNQITLSQIRPHFIFNCLGSIEQLCRFDGEKARTATHRFAKYLRANMDAMDGKSLIPFSMELEHIRNYVWLEQMRFGDELLYLEEIETEGFFIPPLSVQPLVENAIKHGIMGMEEGTLTVKLSVRVALDQFIIQIQDNGNGFDQNEPKQDGRSHIGIQNVREILANAVGGRLTIQSRPGQGVLAEITLPRDYPAPETGKEEPNDHLGSGR